MHQTEIQRIAGAAAKLNITQIALNLLAGKRTRIGNHRHIIDDRELLVVTTDVAHGCRERKCVSQPRHGLDPDTAKRCFLRVNQVSSGLAVNQSAYGQLLIFVLIPGVGREVNGATRWIPLGFFTLQGSEFVKVLAAMFIAGYVARPSGLSPSTLPGYLLPLGLTLLLSVLLLAQPDFGAVIVMMSGVMAVLFFVKTPMKYFLPTVLVGVGVVALLIYLQPYRMARLVAFTDPWAHQFGGGYQLTQALIAIGRGEWLGLGLGNSVQKLFYLPEAHTDFLFSILVEELGIAGALLTLLGFGVLVGRGLIVTKRALRLDFVFHGALAAGISVMLGVQALINLGVNLGLLPTKGLTLPLMSFGGNSLLVSGLMIGLLLRVEWEIRHAPPPPNVKGARS